MRQLKEGVQRLVDYMKITWSIKPVFDTNVNYLRKGHDWFLKDLDKIKLTFIYIELKELTLVRQGFLKVVSSVRINLTPPSYFKKN